MPSHSSEYEPIGAGHRRDEDLIAVQERFAAASRPYLASPWSWVAWSLLLSAAALATRPLLVERGWSAALGMWSLAVLIGGAIEGALIARARREHPTTALGGWVMRAQGNLSLVALALSIALVAAGAPELLPGLWLLLLGHSFYTTGGLGFPPFRGVGLWFQAGGVAALLPWLDSLLVFAVVGGGGTLALAIALALARRAER